MLKILIVDDSKTETDVLKIIFQSVPDFKVVGCAKNGKEAVELNKSLKPDIITMDIHMPIMDGFEATRLIMSQHPTPIIIISSHLNDKDAKTTFFALEAGALCVLEKPSNIADSSFDYTKKQIIDTVRSMAEIKVIRKLSIKYNAKHAAHLAAPIHKKFEIIAIGTSIGGPQALKTIFSALPSNFPIPIVVVQHMAQGFMSSFTKWLHANTTLQIKCAEHLEKLMPGTVYFASDHAHLEIHKLDGQLTAHLVSFPPVSGFCPSATVLLSSVAKTCGINAIGILLTGMGNDGAQGLLEIKKQQGHTLIQEEKSCIVFGMAGVAKSLNAVDKIIELDHFSTYLKKITHNDD